MMSLRYIQVRRKVGRVAAAAILLLASGCSCLVPQSANQEPIAFGVMADIQYSDLDTRWACYYRASVRKLQESVEDLNTRDLAFTIQLGDIIDGHADPDKSRDDLRTILEIYNGLAMPRYHVTGNHCRGYVSEAVLRQEFGLENLYYDFTLPAARGWRFVVLCGTGGSSGVISPEELEWFRATLDQAARNGEKVICFCHYPVVNPAARAAVKLEPGPVLEVMDNAGCVVAWFAGHTHAQGYALRNGVHHVTLSAMVEGPDTPAYAVARLHRDRLEITGFGRALSRTLQLPALSTDEQ